MPKLLTASVKKRRKARKRRKTQAAKAELAGKPPPVSRKSLSSLGSGRWEVVDPTASDTSIDTPGRAPDASGPGELVSDATEDIYSVPLNIFQTVSFLLKFPDAGTGQSESLKQFLMQEYHGCSAEDIGQMAEDIRQNCRSSNIRQAAGGRRAGRAHQR